jgi:cell division protein FtsQ
LRSLSANLSFAGASQPAFAAIALETPAAPRVLLRGERSGRAKGFWALERKAPRGVGVALAAALILAAAGVGAVRGGQYQTFIAAQGGLGDFVAREFGFGVKVVTISGIARLGPREVLELAGVSPLSSVPFFDVDAARARLLKAPLVVSASVRKLYPNRLVIVVTERAPVALWQRDGEVSIVSADGAALDQLRDARLDDLPFVVGEGANKRLPEYLSLLDAAQELRGKIAAGVYVAQRRWNLHMKTGVDVKLPETDPVSAVRTLVKLERESHILERQILSLDLRQPGRAFARLTAEAADARTAALAGKTKKGAKS